MNKQIEALKMAIEAMNKVWDEADFVYLAKALNACKEALAEAEKQEPVAWMNDKTPEGIFARHKEGADNFGCTIPLYIHPATWQSLSDDEINYASYGNTQSDGFCDGAKWAQQALKEKNHD